MTRMATPAPLAIAVDDPARDDVRALLEQHLADMFRTSPAESVHALDVEGLRHPSIAFLTARAGGALLGCAALKTLDATHGELKSMRTDASARGRGVATALLAAVLRTARERGLGRISLETGTQPFFAPARRLYERHGFVECPPFAGYRLDPNSVYFTRAV